MKEQFSFTGRVIEGHHLGHTLGFPTANIVVTPGERVPASAFTLRGSPCRMAPAVPP